MRCRIFERIHCSGWIPRDPFDYYALRAKIRPHSKGWVHGSLRAFIKLNLDFIALHNQQEQFWCAKLVDAPIGAALGLIP